MSKICNLSIWGYGVTIQGFGNVVRSLIQISESSCYSAFSIQH